MINPEYNPRTLYVPRDFLDNETPVSVVHVKNLNIRNPDHSMFYKHSKGEYFHRYGR